VSRVSVHLVVGATRAARGALVAKLLAADNTWRALAPAACPCCVGRVELQVGLARLLRDERPTRVFVELPDASHLAAFRKALAEWPLSQYLRTARALRLPEDAEIGADELRRADD
jgi:hypothetical protein